MRRYAKPPPRHGRAKKMLFSTRMLEETIETKGLQEKVANQDAARIFLRQIRRPSSDFDRPIRFAAMLDPDAPDPYEEEVSLPSGAGQDADGVALRLVLSQVGKGQATFLIRQGYIEITTQGQPCDRVSLSAVGTAQLQIATPARSA